MALFVDNVDKYSPLGSMQVIIGCVLNIDVGEVWRIFYGDQALILPFRIPDTVYSCNHFWSDGQYIGFIYLDTTEVELMPNSLSSAPMERAGFMSLPDDATRRHFRDFWAQFNIDVEMGVYWCVTE